MVKNILIRRYKYATNKYRQYGTELPGERTRPLRAVRSSVYKINKEDIGEPKRKKQIVALLNRRKINNRQTEITIG